MNLTKICPRQDISPMFLVENVTDDPSLSNDNDWAAETLTIWLSRGRDNPPVPITVIGSNTPVMSVTLAPGQWTLVTAVGAPWGGAYYAHTEAKYRSDDLRELSTRQFCHCDDAPEDEPPTTVPPTTAPPLTLPTTTTTVGGG